MHIFDRASACVFLTGFTSVRCCSVKNDKFSHVSRSILCVWWYLYLLVFLFPVFSEKARDEKWKLIYIWTMLNMNDWLQFLFATAVFLLLCTSTLRSPQRRIAFECCSRERPISVKPANKMPIAAFVCECRIACFWFRSTTKSTKVFMIFSYNFHFTTNM